MSDLFEIDGSVQNMISKYETVLFGCVLLSQNNKKQKLAFEEMTVPGCNESTVQTMNCV